MSFLSEKLIIREDNLSFETELISSNNSRNRNFFQLLRSVVTVFFFLSIVSVNIWMNREGFTNKKMNNNFSLNQSSDASDIVEIGQFDNNYGGTAVNVVVENNIAYIANDEDGLLILDVEDLQIPYF